MADEKPTNWWATLPGLLTAAAAVITAVTGLLLGLGQLGVFDAGKPATTSSPSAGREGGAVQPGSHASARTSDPSQGDGVWVVSLPAERRFRSGDIEYEILDAQARPDVDGKIALTFSIRCSNYGRYDINFWDSTFRLNAGGISTAPYPGLNDVVPGDSSKSGDIRFIIPADTRDLVLRIKFPQGDKTVQAHVSRP